ncbi:MULTISPECIES: site-specific integrase [Oceanobacillus]|uniref:Site-specific integrase n=1 Tax=Oceanobacillus neutriphilus TaxID=531815 RepID=A0ABQ2NPZ9_9BACI|nr:MULTISPECIES: site-specific integrase [Oceanobacillus]GGP08843.1 site-specific integrase [Oceanobacillus neutriphilus]
MIKVKKKANGTYEFRVSLGTDPVTGKRIQKRMSGFKTKAEAESAYAKLILDNSEGAYNPNSSMTFEKFTEEFFVPWYKNQVKESTFENRQHTIDKHFTYFYKVSLSDITPLILQQWQLKATEKYSSQYVRGIQGLLSLAFDRAIILGLMKENPSKIIGNVKKIKTKIDFWTKEEFETVISKIYLGDYFQHFQFIIIWLLFMTGMRIGEASALQWEDVDFEEGTLNISKTLYYKNASNYSFTEPKTKASIRLIALDSDTLHLLQNWKEIQQKQCKTNFILSYNGIPTQKHTISYAITRFAKAANIHRIKIHGLRHSHASLLISMGENPLVIKDRLGHEDVQTTLGTYGHLYPNSNFQVADRLSSFIQLKTSDDTQIEHYSSNQYMNTTYQSVP